MSAFVKKVAAKAVKATSKVVVKAKAVEKKSPAADLAQLAEAAKMCESDKCCGKMKRFHHHKGGSCMIYCLGVIGAAIYFIPTAIGFWMTVLACLKALVWPVYIVKGLLIHMGI